MAPMDVPESIDGLVGGDDCGAMASEMLMGRGFGEEGGVEEQEGAGQKPTPTKSGPFYLWQSEEDEALLACIKKHTGDELTGRSASFFDSLVSEWESLGFATARTAYAARERHLKMRRYRALSSSIATAIVTTALRPHETLRSPALSLRLVRHQARPPQGLARNSHLK